MVSLSIIEIESRITKIFEQLSLPQPGKGQKYDSVQLLSIFVALEEGFQIELSAFDLDEHELKDLKNITSLIDRKIRQK
jgi:acyl carrier protein